MKTLLKYYGFGQGNAAWIEALLKSTSIIDEVKFVESNDFAECINSSNHEKAITLIDFRGVQYNETRARIKEATSIKSFSALFLVDREHLDLTQTLHVLGVFDYLEMSEISSRNLERSISRLIQRRSLESEVALLNKAIEQAQISVVITNEKGMIEYVNPFFSELSGYSKEEATGKNPRILKTDYHSPGYYERMWAMLSSGEPWVGKFMNRKKSGELYWENAHITPVLNEAEEITHYIAVKEDISEEESLRYKLDSLMKTIPNPFFFKSIDGILEFVNDAFIEFFGTSREAAVGSHFTEFVSDSEEVELINASDELLFSGSLEKHEYRAGMKNTEGENRELHFYKNAVKDDSGKVVGITGIFIDETEILQNSRKVSEQSAYLERALRISNSGTWRFNVEEQTFLFDTKASEILRLGGRHILSWNELIKRFHAEDREFVQRSFEESWGSGKFIVEHRFDANEEEWWVRVDAEEIQSEDGTQTEVLGVVRDTTHERKSEQLLQDAAKRLQEVMDSSVEEIFSLDTEGRITLFNKKWAQSFEKRWGRSPELGVKMLEKGLLPENRRATLQSWLDRSLKGESITEFLDSEEVAHGDPRFARNLKVEVNPQRNSRNEILGASIFIEDITDRVRYEQDIKEVTERLDLALKGTLAGTWDWHIPSGKTVFNERWAEIVGHTLEELEPISIETWMNFGHPDDLEVSNTKLNDYWSGKADFYDCEVRMKHKDGHYVWVWDRGKTVEWDEEGNPVRMVGTHVDITKRKMAELALEESEYRYRNIIEQINDVIFTLDTTGKFTFVSPGIKPAIGLSPIDLMGKTIFDLVGESDIEKLKSLFNEAVEGVLESEISKFRIVDENGELIYFQTKMRPDLDDQGSLLGFIGIARNISDTIRANEEIEASRRKYEFLTNALDLAIFTADDLGNLTYVNEWSKQNFDLDPEKLLGETWIEVVHPDDRDGAMKKWMHSIATLSPHFHVQRMRLKDGEYKYFEVYARPELDAQNHVVSWVGYSLDIHEREITRRSLESSYDRLKNIAWMQSHEVRAPLARILGLMQLLDPESWNQTLMNQIKLSADELDVIIHKIVEATAAEDDIS